MLYGRSFAERDLGVHESDQPSDLCSPPSALCPRDSRDLQHDLAPGVARLARLVRLPGAVEREGPGEGRPDLARVGEPAQQLEVGPARPHEEELRPLAVAEEGVAGSTAPQKKTPRLGRVVTYVPRGRSTRRQAPKVLLATASKTTS